nr:PREDICTED: uncharacterized protein LOC105663123 [Megachile rotundata]
MEELIASQYELHGRISRTWENLKKTGQQNISIDGVRAALSLLDKKWARLEDQHSQLMRNYRAALKDHDYVTGDFLGTAEMQYTSQRAQLLRLERQFASSSELNPAKPGTTASVAHTPATSVASPSFPRIELPKFSGRFEDWPAFSDLFQSLVIDESALSNVRKLHYLKTSVSGEAESLLKNLPTTDENFQRAWTLLKEHYENKRLLVRAHLNAFLAIPKMKPNSMVDLRRIFHGVVTTAGALEGIGRPISSSEDLFVHLAVNLFDQVTRREWDKSLLKSSEPPSFEQLQAFLKEQVTSEEATGEKCTEPYVKSSLRGGRSVRIAQSRPKAVSASRACPVCGGPHFIATCDRYTQRTPLERKDLVSTHNRCFNCLGRHAVSMCTTNKTCLKCAERHHTSLHEAFAPAPVPAKTPSASAHVAALPTVENATVLLATVRIWVLDGLGKQQAVRALIDPGSEASLAAESLVQRLRLPRSPSCVTIFGVGGQQSGVARGRVSLSITARSGGFTLNVSALVLPRLTGYNGAVKTDRCTWSHVQGLKLADPDYLAADPVELLLGADVYAHILRSGLRRGRDQEPVAQFTSLGWILLGGLRTGPSVPAMTTLHCSQDDNLSSVLQRFWEWEEPSRAEVPFTAEDQKCEELFVSSTKRLPDGRFQVRLPFNIQPTPQLASTKHAAARMLSAMSRRFALDDGFRLKYKEFMEEYLALRHMTPAPPAPSPVEGRLCYLPHHGVLKSTEGNVKLRVVFNGSARTSTGISLNSCLFAGPNLMSSLPDIILRWRRHRYAFVADIEKMYRQIVVHPDDRDLQRILWELNGTVSEFQLNTVTYGTACAPFLAVRVLHQLANDEEEKFPAGAAALRHDCYVDDILSGASSLAAGRQLQSELTAVSMAGGFPLRKWAANHPDLLEGVPSSHRLAASGVSDLPHEEHAVLGVRWSPSDDCLMMATTIMADPVPTKRSLLSRVARLFDPLGWLAPVVVLTKMLIQTTWLQQLEWDTPLAPTEATTWINILDDLPVLEAVKIPRWFIGFTPEGNVELHGFADASERAYGAVIYLRTVQNGKISVSLVQAKTRVAPLKRVSLPRLELCAAALLAKLSVHVKMVLGLQAVPTFHWSDSTVTLAWIRGHPTKWATFVANRVAEIQRQSDAVRWCHVPGTENPADCASRGLMPRELATHPLWWQGPPFLRSESASWPKMEDPLQDADVPEQRSKRCYAVKLETVEPPELTRFSDLRRLLRVTAWILRWRSRRSAEKISTVATDALVLLPQELEAALLQWVRITQRIAFPRELEDVRAGRAVHGRSALRKLTPFIDKDGILRVGGRIKHALLNADQKHPIILATQSHLSQLIVEAHHRRTLHAGTQTTLASIRQRYWLLART